jgi:hypothetical protein
LCDGQHISLGESALVIVAGVQTNHRSAATTTCSLAGEVFEIRIARERNLIDYQKVRHERPILVWLISLFGLLYVIWMVLAIILAQSGAVHVERLDVSLLEKLPTIVLGVLIVTAAVALFLLRKVTPVLFLSALGLNLVLTLIHMSQTGWFEEFWGQGSVAKLIWHIYLIAASIYVWRLSKNDGLH